MKLGNSPANEELMDALMLALAVAQAGREETPPVDPPDRLKHFLSFKKLPKKVWEQVREVLDDDEEFRERVAAVSDAEHMDRTGWLWLNRPDGWEEEWETLASEAEREAEQAQAAQEIAELKQQLQKAEADRDKASDQRDKEAKERKAAKTEASKTASAAKQAEKRANQKEEELRAAKAALKQEQASLKKAQDKEARTDKKLKSAQEKNERLNKELRAVRQQHTEEMATLKARLAAAEDQVALAREAGFEPPTEPEPDPEPDPEPPPPLTERTPHPLPEGMLHDTVEATKILLGVSGIVVLIDGYNVTFKSWKDMPVREQRHRFLQKLEELSSRFSAAEFVVVFDGQQTDYDYIATTSRSLGVTVRFSLPGVTADDHIIAMCDNYPLEQSLVVVSEDNAVRERARDRGARPVHPRKLLEVMGLEVEDPEGWASFGG